MQRCSHYVPGLRSRPWWSVRDVPEAIALEASSESIGREFEDLVLTGRLRLHPHSPGGSRRPLTDGDWNIFELWNGGLPHAGNLIEAPVTTKVLSSVGAAIRVPRGRVYFSVLPPGAHVEAHCGPTNTRIRLHLGLRIPPEATMRVGTETRSWQEGKCLAFDDSFEHEVANPSQRARSVLLVDIWHPDLSAEQRKTQARDEEALRSRGARSWRRQSGVSATDSDPIDPAIFAMLGHGRLTRITSAARLACGLDFPVIAGSARRVLDVVATGAPEQASVQAQPAARVTDDVVWAELAGVASDAMNHGLSPYDLVELAILCSISWRTWPGRANAMDDFLEQWPAADKASCADGLVSLGTVPRMISALRELNLPSGPPPFGALVPLLCAAHRGSLTTESHHKSDRDVRALVADDGGAAV